MAPHSSTLAWKIPRTEEPGRLQSMGSLGVGHGLDTTERLHFHFSLSCIGEGNGNPLQCFCLENPRDGGAWWAAVYGVAQNQTRLKRLSSSIYLIWGQGMVRFRSRGSWQSWLWGSVQFQIFFSCDLGIELHTCDFGIGLHRGLTRRAEKQFIHILQQSRTSRELYIIQISLQD